MPDKDALVEVVITAPDEEWLASFTRALVEQHLAAAAHLSPIRSVYTWQGQIHDRVETRAALHTREALFGEIKAIVGRKHPYDVACVIALPITSISADYRCWVLDSTKKA